MPHGSRLETWEARNLLNKFAGKVTRYKERMARMVLAQFSKLVCLFLPVHEHCSPGFRSACGALVPGALPCKFPLRCAVTPKLRYNLMYRSCLWGMMSDRKVRNRSWHGTGKTRIGRISSGTVLDAAAEEQFLVGAALSSARQALGETSAINFS